MVMHLKELGNLIRGAHSPSGYFGESPCRLHSQKANTRLSQAECFWAPEEGQVIEVFTYGISLAFKGVTSQKSESFQFYQSCHPVPRGLKHYQFDPHVTGSEFIWLGISLYTYR